MLCTFSLLAQLPGFNSIQALGQAQEAWAPTSPLAVGLNIFGDGLLNKFRKLVPALAGS